MDTNIFTYGSLMFPQVWQRVVHGSYRSAQAVVTGHDRFSIAGQIYPGMVALPGAAVQGVVYFDVSARDIAALDAFEGKSYRRDRLGATLESGTAVTVNTYIYVAGTRLSDAPWRPEEFQLQRFLDTYCHARLRR